MILLCCCCFFFFSVCFFVFFVVIGVAVFLLLSCQYCVLVFAAHRKAKTSYQVSVISVCLVWICVKVQRRLPIPASVEPTQPKEIRKVGSAHPSLCTSSLMIVVADVGYIYDVKIRRATKAPKQQFSHTQQARMQNLKKKMAFAENYLENCPNAYSWPLLPRNSQKPLMLQHRIMRR